MKKLCLCLDKDPDLPSRKYKYINDWNLEISLSPECIRHTVPLRTQELLILTSLLNECKY